MSIFTDRSAAEGLGEFALEPCEDARRAGGPAATAAETLEERRTVPRFRTAFRPACVVVDGRIVLGMLRNMSGEGVMIELDHDLAIGQRVAYFWDEQRLVNATVAWAEGNRYGLDNEASQQVFDTRHTYRSVRVPCEVEATVWVRGERHLVRVENLSLGGMRVRGIKAWKGAPLTIEIAGLELCNACVAWAREDASGHAETGIRFAESLSRSQLAAILSHESVRFDRVTFG